ncbi:Rho-type GTPase-activating protein 2 [Nakaseomyces bracarensis]|uniref:Rho-type GTPase-activating protein 2 n=1 Tax=Nakaseomyces bracarensis TaxID=273131 RepID=A0ABR4NUG7_9SACH
MSVEVEESSALPICVKCKEPITTGHAYELGYDRWHIECFACHKCDKVLTCDSDFLVLGTGALICFECSDSCKSCGKKIDDLAIILSSSNEAYCSECFKCCKCNESIQDLRYAKTKKGLFCLNCHEKLLAKRRTYDEKKRKLLEKKHLPRIPTITDDDCEPALQTEVNRSVTDGVEARNMGIQRRELRQSNNLAIPKRSRDRPMSVYRSTNGDSDSSRETSLDKSNDSLVKSTSDSIITHYLDPVVKLDERPEIKLPPRPSNNETQNKNSSLLSPTRVVHQRKTSIDANLEEFHTATEFQSPLKNELLKSPLRESQIKSPLRNGRHDPAMKSPKSYRRGMILETDEDENTPDSFNILECFDPERDPKLMAPPIVGSVDTSVTDFSETNSTEIGLEEKQRIDKDFLGSSLFHKQNLSRGSISIPSVSASLDSSETVQPLDILENDKSRSQDNLNSKNNNYDRYIKTPQFRNSDPELIKSTDSRSNQYTSTRPLQLPSDAQDNFNASSLYEKNLKRETLKAEIHLKKLREEVEAMRNRKKKYQKELDEMKNARKEIRISLDTLRTEWEQLKSQIDDSVIDQSTDEIIVPNNDRVKSNNFEVAETASVARSSGSKPRFWKLFSKQNNIPPMISQPMQIPMQAMNYGINSTAAMFSHATGHYNDGSPSKLDISHPVLKNTNEFDDLKLVSIQNSKESNINRSESPVTSDGSQLYGSSLVARAQYEGYPIPLLVSACVKYVESSEEFLTTEGIYRISGSQLRIEELEKQFAHMGAQNCADVQKGQIDGIPSFLYEQDLHTITGVLKRYLRKLPNPVLTYQVYEPLISLIREQRVIETLPLINNKITTESKSSEKYFFMVDTLQKILSNLPESHYEVLKLLSRHVCKINKYSGTNLMNIRNLALIFSPGLLRDYSGIKDLEDMRERDYIITFLFTYHEEILP